MKDGMTSFQRAFLGLMVAILIGSFYWFQLRPSNIRKQCNERVLKEQEYSTSKAEREQLNNEMVKINAVEREKADFFYKDCLHQKGIEK